MEYLEAGIRLADEFSNVFDLFERRVRNTGGVLGELGNVIGGGAGGVFGMAVGGVALLGAAMVSFVMEMGPVIAKMKEQEAEVNSLAATYGFAAAEIVGAVQKASRGTLTETQAIMQANQLMVADINQSFRLLDTIGADGAAGIMEMARAIALLKGGDPGQIAEQLAAAFREGSIPAIDSATKGLYNMAGASDQWEAANNRSLGTLDRATRALTLYNLALQQNARLEMEAGIASETAAEKQNRLTAQKEENIARFNTMVMQAPLPMLGGASLADVWQQGMDAATAFFDFIERRTPDAEGLTQVASRVHDIEAATATTTPAADALRAAIIGIRDAVIGPEAVTRQIEQMAGALEAAANQALGIAPPPLPKTQGLATDANELYLYANALRALGPEWANAADAAASAGQRIAYAQSLVLATAAAMNTPAEAMQYIASQLFGAGAGVDDLARRWAEVPPAVQAGIDAMDVARSVIAQLRADASAPIGIQITVAAQALDTQLQSSLSRLVGVLPIDEISAKYEELRKAGTDELLAYGEQVGATAFETELYGKQIAKGTEDWVNGVITSHNNLTRSTSNSAAALETVKSRIEKALMLGNTPTALDMLQTQAGTYQDKPLESARQLDAIAARGFAEIKAHPDWAAILQIPPEVLSGSEAGLKAWAQGTAEAVRDLTRPDLVNWDAFAEQYSKLQQDEVAKKATIDRGVQILSEKGLLKGVPAGQARQQMAKMMGLDDPQGTMAVLGSEITAALSGQDVGKDVLGAWNKSFANQQKGFEAMGETLGQQVSGAFVEAMKSGVGNVRQDIANIVAPEVAKILSRKKDALE